MKFSRLTVNDWRQFSKIDLKLHPRMTIITGANGAGKTTLLRILSQHFGWPGALLATPQKKSGETAFTYAPGLWRLINDAASSAVPRNLIGLIEYSNNTAAQLYVPESGGPQYAVEIRTQQPINGLHISSQRPPQFYQPIGSIPTAAIGAEQAYQIYSNENLQRMSNGYTQYSPVYRMKEALISMAMFGAGNEYVEKNEGLERLFLEFKQILAEVLPPSIGFRDISVRIPDVVLITKSGDFMIDAASGGLMALIDLAYQIFLYSHNKDEFVVVIDEPENHLHPSMQRSLLGRLVSAFPNAQFIVATHSPFIVSSIKDSIVHALMYERDETIDAREEFSDAKVVSIELELGTKASTAGEILRDVLGVPVTLPQWAEDDLQQITRSLTQESFTTAGLTDLRASLAAAGLSEYFPEAIKMVADQTK